MSAVMVALLMRYVIICGTLYQPLKCYNRCHLFITVHSASIIILCKNEIDPSKQEDDLK